jgi:hypothetical protein
MANETTAGDTTTTQATTDETKSFIAQAQEKLSGAVDATVGAVKDHPVAAAAIAAGAAAAVGGAAYAATQLGRDKPSSSGGSGKSKK